MAEVHHIMMISHSCVAVTCLHEWSRCCGLLFAHVLCFLCKLVPNLWMCAGQGNTREVCPRIELGRTYVQCLFCVIRYSMHKSVLIRSHLRADIDDPIIHDSLEKIKKVVDAKKSTSGDSNKEGEVVRFFSTCIPHVPRTTLRSCNAHTHTRTHIPAPPYVRTPHLTCLSQHRMPRLQNVLNLLWLAMVLSVKHRCSSPMQQESSLQNM